MSKKESSSSRDFIIALSLFIIGTGVMLYVIFGVLSFINTTVLPQAGILH
jgi:hypothetical protein